MEYTSPQHKELHELLLLLNFKPSLDPLAWNYEYLDNDGKCVYFNRVNDYSIYSSKAGLELLSDLSIDDVLSTLRNRLLLSHDSLQFRINVESCGVVSFNTYTPDEIAFLDAAALVLIQVEYQGKHLTYAEAYAEAVNMLKARRECLGGEHD